MNHPTHKPRRTVQVHFKEEESNSLTANSVHVGKIPIDP